MHSHINITMHGKDINLGDVFSLPIEFRNPLWNDTEMFSYPVQIPFHGNRHIISNIDDVNSDLRPIDLEHMPVRISVDGMPFRTGTAVMTEDEELADSLTLNVSESEQSLSDLIGNMKCRDVQIDDNIQIGEKIGKVYFSAAFTQIVHGEANGSYETIAQDKTQVQHEFSVTPPALGFSYPAQCVEDFKRKAEVESSTSYEGISVNKPKVFKSFINTSAAFGDTDPAGRRAVYCNARVCYMHYAKGDDGKTSDDIVKDEDGNESVPESIYPYWVLPAERQQSGICFYVLYFLECLFRQLGFEYDQSALMAVEDLRHLCFFTTKCKYTTRTIGSRNLDSKMIDDWLSSRGCGGKIEIAKPKKKSIATYTNKSDWYFRYDQFGDGESIITKTIPAGTNLLNKGKKAGNIEFCDDMREIAAYADNFSYVRFADLDAMYATSDNLPEDSVSSVLSSLENQFGIRFRIDYEMKKVKAYFLRDVYRQQTPVRHFRGTVLSMNKVSEKITGVRNRYSAESNVQEQRENVRYGVRDYDTTFDYIEYPQDRTVTDRTYQQIIQNISGTDMNVYIDLTTGNAYRIKIDGDANDVNSLHPVLFEVGSMKGVDYGDCSLKNEDYIHELVSDFNPVIFNDVSSSQQRKYFTSESLLAAYVDVEMEHEFIRQNLTSHVSYDHLDFVITQSFCEKESYDPTKTDNGESPLQNYDWGLAIAMMRGGGSDGSIQDYDLDYDGFGNSRWRSVAATYAMSPDTMDNFGNEYDYNGSEEGIGNGERFSLKIRAFKQPDWSPQPLCNASVARRGTFDTFLSEHAHFLVNRKKYIVRVLATAAELADIPNHWHDRYEFDGIPCYINKISYTLSAKEGISEVELEVYSL